MTKRTKDPDDIAIGNRIRAFREEIKESRETFAKKTTLSVPFIYDIEVGNKGISAKSLKKIVSPYRKQYGLTADYLLFGDDEDVLLGALSPSRRRAVEAKLEDVLKILKK